jgi:NADH:ubiquinone oxidoreductase subunit 5 (subunit L)/multisubunit Na+/H+ antiporter MnhA subunit
MMGPLVVLAILSLVGGVALDKPIHQWLGRVWSSEKAIETNLHALAAGTMARRGHAREELIRIGEEVVAKLPQKPQGDLQVHVDFIKIKLKEHEEAHKLNMLISSILFVVGAGAALLLYTRARPWLARQVAGPLKGLHWLVSNKFFVDEIYEYLVVAPVKMGATVVWFVIDRVLIDTVLVNGTARVVYAVGGAVRRPHTGSINVGALSFLIGFLAILAILALKAWKIIF